MTLLLTFSSGVLRGCATCSFRCAIGMFAFLGMPAIDVHGGHTGVSPISARDAVAAGALATRSLRSGSVPFDVPELDSELAAYFHRGQHNPH